MNKDFLKICKRFNEYVVKYIVCGAYACKLQGIEKVSGQERLTNDFDFIVETSEDNISRIKSALKDINPKIIDLRNYDLKKYQTVKIVGKIEIDLISNLWQIDYETAIKDLEIKEIEGIEIPVLGITQLIETKKNSFRERDKADTHWLNKIKSG